MSARPSTLEIVGAGPAGLAAAITAARSGVRVLVHEQRDRVGARFHGDFQGLENWTTRGDVLDELAQLGLPPDLPVTAFGAGVFFDPDGGEHRCSASRPLFYLVRRGSGDGTLDQALLENALSLGVEVRFEDKIESLPEGGIVARGPRAADVIAVGYTFETDASDAIFGVISDRLAPKGYSYLLVHEGHGTVAACLFEDFHSEQQYLERTVAFFEERVGLKMREPRRFGGSGHFAVPGRARRGRLSFVGEAAGFQDALWGFGMRYAMLSGCLAAEAIVQGRPDDYERLWRRRLGGLVRASLVNRALYARLGDHGYRRFLERLDRARDPRDWLRGHYRGSLWKNLAFELLARRRSGARAIDECVQEGCTCTWCRCHREASER